MSFWDDPAHLDAVVNAVPLDRLKCKDKAERAVETESVPLSKDEATLHDSDEAMDEGLEYIRTGFTSGNFLFRQLKNFGNFFPSK